MVLGMTHVLELPSTTEEGVSLLHQVPRRLEGRIEEVYPSLSPSLVGT